MRLMRVSRSERVGTVDEREVKSPLVDGKGDDSFERLLRLRRLCRSDEEVGAG